MKLGRVEGFFYSILLLTLNGSTESALDLGSCTTSKIPVEKNIDLSEQRADVDRIVEARSKLECVVNCINSKNECQAAFHTQDGVCHHLEGNGENKINGILASANSFMRMILTGEHDNCNGMECSDDEICFAGCREEVLESPVCLDYSRSSCDFDQEYLGARHYFSGIIQDDRDSGSVMRLVYPKKKSTSGLRVIAHIPIRAHVNVANLCNHWYLTFNGNKCTNPGNIEQLDFSSQSVNYVRAMDIDGTCYGLDEGDQQVDLVVGSCEGFANTNALTGWQGYRTILVIEIDSVTPAESQTSKSCPGLNNFNYKYFSWNEKHEAVFNTSAQNMLVKAIEYTKRASDTHLRVKFNAPMTLIIPDSNLLYCGRWYIGVNGSECTPNVDVVISSQDLNSNFRWENHTRVRTVEGICENQLPSGVYSVEIYLGKCIDDNSEPTHFVTGGFNSPSRIHIEEVRSEQRVDAVYGSQQQIYRSLVGHLQSYYWPSLNDDTDDGTIVTVSYDKQFADTALRLTSTGAHKSAGSGSGNCCVKWYFEIDGSPCTSPGEISGQSYINYANVYHHPMQVSGICHDVLPGTRSITYNTMQCRGMHVGNAYTGWKSSFFIFVEELRLEKMTECSGNPVDCGGP